MVPKNKNNRIWINLGLDGALVAGFLISFKPLLTGLAVHEWLGLAVGAALAAHAALHFKWIVGVTRKLVKLPAKTRLYYAIDALLAIAFAAILVSGLAMSYTVLPLLGLTGSASLIWFTMHKLASQLTLALLGIKLVLHYKWFVTAFKKLGHRHPRPSTASVVEQPVYVTVPRD